MRGLLLAASLENLGWRTPFSIQGVAGSNVSSRQPGERTGMRLPRIGHFTQGVELAVGCQL